jgi:hypothetical protein
MSFSTKPESAKQHQWRATCGYKAPISTTTELLQLRGSG